MGVLEDDLDVAPQLAHIARALLLHLHALELHAARVGSSRRINSRPSVDLPAADSPTTPSVSPGRALKLTPSTAL